MGECNAYGVRGRVALRRRETISRTGTWKQRHADGLCILAETKILSGIYRQGTVYHRLRGQPLLRAAGKLAGLPKPGKTKNDECMVSWGTWNIAGKAEACGSNG